MSYYRGGGLPPSPPPQHPYRNQQQQHHPSNNSHDPYHYPPPPHHSNYQHVNQRQQRPPPYGIYHHADDGPPPSPEDGLFISATETQRKMLVQAGATSLRSLFNIIANDSDYRAQRPVNAPEGAVLKMVLFAWCRNEGRGVHLCLDESIDAGYVVEGGSFPHEWVCCVAEWPTKPASAPNPTQLAAPQPDDRRSFPALGQTLDDPSAFPALGQAPPPAMAAYNHATHAATPGHPPSLHPSQQHGAVHGCYGGTSLSHSAGGFASPPLGGGLGALWEGGLGGGGAHGFPQLGSLPLAPSPPTQPTPLPPRIGYGGLSRPLPAEAPSGSLSSLWGAQPPGPVHDSLGAHGLGSAPGGLPRTSPSDSPLLRAAPGMGLSPHGSIGDVSSGWAAVVRKPSSPATFPPPPTSAEEIKPTTELSSGCHLFDHGGHVVARLHQTNIVIFREDGTILLNSGGWRTMSTLRAINSALKLVEPPTKLVADGHISHGSWRVEQAGGASVEFHDDLVVVASMRRDVVARLFGGAPAPPPRDTSPFADCGSSFASLPMRADHQSALIRSPIGGSPIGAHRDGSSEISGLLSSSSNLPLPQLYYPPAPPPGASPAAVQAGDIDDLSAIYSIWDRQPSDSTSPPAEELWPAP